MTNRTLHVYANRGQKYAVTIAADGEVTSVFVLYRRNRALFERALWPKYPGQPMSLKAKCAANAAVRQIEQEM